MRMRVGLFGLLLIAGQTAAHGEGVNASRYVLPLAASTIAATEVVDQARLEEFCRDADGCTVTLRLQGSGILTVASERLFLHEGGLHGRGERGARAGGAPRQRSIEPSSAPAVEHRHALARKNAPARAAGEPKGRSISSFWARVFSPSGAGDTGPFFDQAKKQKN